MKRRLDAAASGRSSGGNNVNGGESGPLKPLTIFLVKQSGVGDRILFRYVSVCLSVMNSWKLEQQPLKISD